MKSCKPGRRRMMWASTLLIGVLSLGVGGCGETEETQRHDIDVATDGSQLTGVETDEGYEVDVQDVRFRIDRVDFTVEGEVHDDSQLGWRERLRRAVLSEARAHPNHAAGGETGGTFGDGDEIQWTPGEVQHQGTGAFLEGDFSGYDLFFRGEGDDEQSLDDGLIARIEAVATASDGEVVEFGASFEFFEGAQVHGGALSAQIPGDGPEAVALQLSPYDEWSETSMFDGIAFSNLVDGQEGRIELDPETVAHSRLRRGLTAHEYYGGRLIEE